MNTGTKIRTALRVAVSLNTAIYVVSDPVGNLGWGWLTIAWAVLTIISDFAVAFVTTWYNNDYTEEACIGTGVTRLLKAQAKDGYIGEVFDDMEEEIDEKTDI